MPEIARTDEIETIAALFADGFMEDPVWSAILPNSRSRRRALRDEYLRVLDEATSTKPADTVGDPATWDAPRVHQVDVVRGEDGQILGALHFSAPGRLDPRPSFRQRVAAKLTRQLVPAARRGSKHDAAVHSHQPREDHWYFRDLVISPEAQGKGIGSSLLAARLAVVDENPAPVFLEATSKASRRLYERFGFEQVAVVNAVPGATAYIMVRPAKDTATA